MILELLALLFKSDKVHAPGLQRLGAKTAWQGSFVV